MPEGLVMPGYPWVVTFHAHWGENDALGHVNNTRYFRWFETARIAAMRAIGTPFAHGRREGPILAETGCTFLKPLVAPVDVCVGARLAHVGRTSFRMEHGVALRSAPEELVARGYAAVVWLDYAAGKPVPIPDEIRAAAETVLRG